MRCFCLLVVVLIFVQCIISQLKQERAMMNYCNPEFVAACYGITRRIRRGEPYKTNFSVTSRYISGNNITLRVVLYGGLTVELLKIKLCDVTKVDWLYAYLKTYGNISDRCPYKAAKYELTNLVFPPKNLPRTILSLLEGKFYSKFFFITTKTEDLLLEATITFNAS